MKNTLLLSSALCWLIAAPSALAQSASRSSADETIVVTGQRAPQRDLDFETDAGSRTGLTNRETPAIVDVLTQADFQNQGLSSAIDALNAAPGVFAGNDPGAIGLGSLRGFTRGTNFQYDGVRTSTPGSEFRNWDSWSFERIEVLKGPASVLSGDGALVGTINFVPKQPRLGQSGAEALVSYGSFDTWRLAGGVNAPLGETAAARFDIVGSQSSGWITDNDSITFAATGAVLWKPTNDLTLRFSVDHFEDEFAAAYYGVPLVPRAFARDPSDVATGPGGLVFDNAMREVNYDVNDGVVDSNSTWLRARVDYTLSGAWSLRNDFSYFDGDRSWTSSDVYSFNAGTGLVDRTTTLITHGQGVVFDRATLSYDGPLAGRRNRFTIGAEAMLTGFDSKRRFGATTSVDPLNPARGVFPTTDTPADFGTRQQVRADVDNYAVFAEDAYNVTPDLILVGSVRLDQIELSRSITNVTSGAVTPYANTYEPFNWRIGAVYSVLPQTQLFAQYSSAALPVSGFLFISAANSRFDLTTGESFEAGVKSDIWGDRVQVTASVFHIRQEDILTRDPANPAVSIQGGSQVSTGIEASISASLTDELQLDLGAAFLHAEFDELLEAGGANRSGNLPSNTPEQLVDLTATWSPAGTPFSVFGAVRYTDEFFTDNANTIRVAPVTLIDAGVTWRTPFADISVRGRNLTDEVYANLGFGSQIELGAPRSVELTLTRSF